METLKLFWFFLWRMALWGLGLGAVAMAVFAVFEIVLMLSDGVYYGAFYTVGMVVVSGILGAYVGTLLGLLCGVALFAYTRAFFWPRPAEHSKYYKTAGWACALASVLALIGDWTIRILRDRYSDLYSNVFTPRDFIVWRFIQGHEHSGTYSVSTMVVELTTIVAIPTLLFALVMWWAGRRTARQYMGRFEVVEGSNHSPATGHERPEPG